MWQTSPPSLGRNGAGFFASPAEQWKHSHNELHHTYTNVIGKDNDLGYGIMRVDEDQRWVPLYLAQPLWNFINACFFEYGIAAYDLELGKNLQSKQRRRSPEFRARAQQTLKKIRQQMTKDYVVHPLVSGPSALSTLAANATANLARNLWTHSVIMCGHFPDGVETFERRSITGESRGEWYLVADAPRRCSCMSTAGASRAESGFSPDRLGGDGVSGLLQRHVARGRVRAGLRETSALERLAHDGTDPR